MFNDGDSCVKRKRVREKDGGVLLFIVIQSGLCIFEILLWDSRVFFGQVSFPSDQEGLSEWGVSVAQDLIYFIFFFSHDEVRWGGGKVQTVYIVFAIG